MHMGIDVMYIYKKMLMPYMLTFQCMDASICLKWHAASANVRAQVHLGRGLTQARQALCHQHGTLAKASWEQALLFPGSKISSETPHMLTPY